MSRSFTLHNNNNNNDKQNNYSMNNHVNCPFFHYN